MTDGVRRSLKSLDEKLLFLRSEYCFLKDCGEGIRVDQYWSRTLIRNADDGDRDRD